MRFELAWCLWLAIPLAAYAVWLSRRGYAQLRPWARAVSLTLRILVLLLLVATLSQPDWLKRSDRRHVLFVLDVSRSVTAENLDAALDDIDRLAKEAIQRDRARLSVIGFGQNPTVLVRGQNAWDGWPKNLREQLHYETTLSNLYAQRTRMISAGAQQTDEMARLNERITVTAQLCDRVTGDRTDVEAALRLALNLCDAGESGTIYLFTDGHFNHGQWMRAFSAAKSADVRIHTITLDRQPPPEVAAADLSLPPTVRVNQGFSAELRVASTVETSADLRIFKDGYSQPPQTVELHPGENTIHLTGLYFREKGFHTVEAALRPAVDTQIANNTIRSLVIVPGPTRVLYVDGDEREMPYLKSALELEGIQVETRPATGVPRNLSDLLGFDAFILSNVPADRLNLPQMRMIRTYVQDFGGGFLMLGGDESFGLGGYYSTPIEEILPVRMPIQKNLTRPSLALLLVIDKSGSMDGAKIQLAKRAAIATAEAINPRDLIGVIGFDSEAQVLLELTPAADRATISGHIASLDAGGGTFLYPALEAAHLRLSESNARRKHIIVLSDGQTQGFGYEEQAGGMAADGITISTIGIGEGADMKLMEAMAYAGGGRCYFTNDFYTIPQIFTREALRASNTMLVERLVQPVPVGQDVALAEIDLEELPLLTGYVATTAKPTGNLIIAAENGDPLLAKWRYGLGRAAAFTSEPKPHWAEDWIAWDDFAKFWSQLVRSLTTGDLDRKISLECTHILDDDGVLLTAEVQDENGLFLDLAPTLNTLGADGRPRPLPVTHSGPGTFEARLPDFAFGKDQQFVWHLTPRVSQASADTPASAMDPPTTNGTTDDGLVTSYGFVYSFSPEYAAFGPSAATLEQIRDRDAGEMQSVGQARLCAPGAPTRQRLALWPYLLAAALLLVPFDILVRRIG